MSAFLIAATYDLADCDVQLVRWTELIGILCSITVLLALSRLVLYTIQLHWAHRSARVKRGVDVSLRISQIIGFAVSLSNLVFYIDGLLLIFQLPSDGACVGFPPLLFFSFFFFLTIHPSHEW